MVKQQKKMQKVKVKNRDLSLSLSRVTVNDRKFGTQRLALLQEEVQSNYHDYVRQLSITEEFPTVPIHV